ncbi:MAG: hypothetical protein WCL32_14495, partial [Planctomycetota bacterium]
AMTRTAMFLGMALACGLVGAAAAAAEPIVGNPKLQSIESISFAPDGVLLIGDGRGAQVVAVHTGDVKPGGAAKILIADLTKQIGARLGTDAKGVEIIKLAVNPASERVYLAVRKLSNKQDLILKVDGDKLEELPLENVKHQRFALPADDKAPVVKITDVTFADGRILLAVQAKEQFASKIYSIDTRQDDAAPYFISTETFHVAHARWETNAPIRTVIPYKEGGKTYLVGAFTCTPIVKYSLDDVKSGGRVQGKSVIELGNGNTPQDMFVYEKAGKSYILMNNFRMAKFHEKNPVGPSPYWTAKVEHGILTENEKVNEKALWRVGAKANESKTDRVSVAQDFHGVMMMDRMGADRAAVIRADNAGTLSLEVVPLP